MSRTEKPQPDLDPERDRFEREVVLRLAESGYMEVEVRIECLPRDGDGYRDASVDAYWHFFRRGVALATQDRPTRLIGTEDGVEPSWAEPGTPAALVYDAVATSVTIEGNNLDGYELAGLDRAATAVLDLITSGRVT